MFIKKIRNQISYRGCKIVGMVCVKMMFRRRRADKVRDVPLASALTSRFSMSLPCHSTNLPSNPQLEQHNIQYSKRAERDGYEKGALSIAQAHIGNISLFNNTRADIIIQSGFLSQSIRQSLTSTPRIPECNPQNRSMAEAIAAKVLDARIPDFV
jgi:hypothetical protein